VHQTGEAKEKSLIRRGWPGDVDGPMKPPLRFAILLVVALAFVPFLPLYVEQTMTELMFADGSGGAIEWGWKICNLKVFFSDYRYIRQQPHPELWIALNVALALAYAAAIAFLVALILGRKRLGNSHAAKDA
jgi:hypothetical protein